MNMDWYALALPPRVVLTFAVKKQSVLTCRILPRCGDAGIPLFALLRLTPPVALDRPLLLFSTSSLSCGPLLRSSAFTLEAEE